MAEKCDFFQLKLTLRELRIELILPQHLQHCSQMHLVGLYIGRIYQHVIYKHHHKLIQIGPEYSVHQVHESSWCIRQPKWHDQELIMAIPSPKGCLLYIGLPNSELVITRS